MKRSLPLLLFLLSAGAHGALNRWVDAEGKIHYSDEPPPPDVKAKVLTPPPVAAPAQKSVAEREAELKKAQKAEEASAQREAVQKEEMLSKQKYCETLRANLATLESNIPIVNKNEKGESAYLDDASRQQQIETTRKAISEGCN